MLEALNHVGTVLAVCDHIITTNIFTIKSCGEVFKIQSGPLNCNSEKILYLLRCKICDDTPYVGKVRTKFRLWFNSYKSKHQSFRKRKQNVSKKRFHSHHVQDCHRGIYDWEVMHKQLKERKTFWQHKLKIFYPLGLMNKKNIYFNHFSIYLAPTTKFFILKIILIFFC